jgi:hypothetical protein
LTLTVSAVELGEGVAVLVLDGGVVRTGEGKKVGVDEGTMKVMEGLGVTPLAAVVVRVALVVEAPLVLVAWSGGPPFMQAANKSSNAGISNLI